MISDCRCNGVAYSEELVVTNSLRLRGAKVEERAAVSERVVGEQATVSA